MKKYQLIKKYISILQHTVCNRGILYIVGGFLRDYILSYESNDLDFVCFTNAKSIASKFAEVVNRKIIVLDDNEGSYRVVKDSLCFDFNQARGQSLEEDLGKRDFTINTLSIDVQDYTIPLSKNKILDLYMATNSIKESMIISSNLENFHDDPLRMLRAFRLASKYKFRIDSNILDFIKNHSRIINRVAPERIAYEIVQFFSNDKIFDYCLQMSEYGLLDEIFDHIRLMKKEETYYLHKDGLWGHSLEVLFCLEKIIEDMHNLFSEEVLIRLNEFLSKYSYHLKMLALFHDIAKPYTLKVDGKKISFINHDKIGSKIFKSSLKSNRFSSIDTEIIGNGIKFHMQSNSTIKLPNITNRACFRFFKRTNEFGIGLILFSLADIMASIRGSYYKTYPIAITEEDYSYPDFSIALYGARKMLKWHIAYSNKGKIKSILDGYDIMNHLSISPSREVGALLRGLEEAQAIGQIGTKDEAFLFIEEEYARFKGI